MVTESNGRQPVGAGSLPIVRWYDRNGREITSESASMLLADDSYRILATAQVGPLTVETRWCGVDAEGQLPLPMVFETQIAPAEPSDWRVRFQRYPSEKLALIGHVRAIAWAHDLLDREGTDGPPPEA